MLKPSRFTSCHLLLLLLLHQAVRRLWALINRSIESAAAREPERPRAAVEAAVKGRYLVLDMKQRGLSLSQEGMALLFSLMLQEPDVVFRCVLCSSHWALCDILLLAIVFCLCSCGLQVVWIAILLMHSCRERCCLLLSKCSADKQGCMYVCRSAVREGRPPNMMDLWEDDVPWGNMAITALKVRPRG